MLSEEILRQVRRVDKVDTPRTTIEFLLVIAQVKPGDVVDWIKKDEKHEIMKEIIDETPNLNWFRGVKKMPSNTYYYNVNLVSDEFIDDLKNTNDYFSIKEGMLFGYKAGCLLANEKGTTISEKMPATEHYWCSKDCKKSIEMQEIYIKIVDENLPKYSNMIREKSLMGLEIIY